MFYQISLSMSYAIRIEEIDQGCKIQDGGDEDI